MIKGASVVLSGATGFLGSHLLAELLAGGADTVHCLVRAAHRDEAWARLDAVARGYGLDAPDPARVAAVPADLGSPLLGLAPAGFQELAAGADLVVHSGAQVNLSMPYATLKAANVGGTQEMLRLAAARRAPVHHVSTLSVFGQPDGVVPEVFEVPQVEGLSSGYARSKWVADRMVAGAWPQGLPVAVHRTGRLFANGRTAGYNRHDLLVQVVRACLILRAAPELSAEVLIAPVDWVARTLCHLIDSDDVTGRAYHIVGLTPLAWPRMIELMNNVAGPMRTVSYERWRSLLLTDGVDDERLQRLATMMGVRPPWAGSWSVSMDNTRAALGDTLASTYPPDTDGVVTRMLHAVREDLSNTG